MKVAAVFTFICGHSAVTDANGGKLGLSTVRLWSAPSKVNFAYDRSAAPEPRHFADG